jgi:hypothetical protein
MSNEILETLEKIFKFTVFTTCMYLRKLNINIVLYILFLVID